MLINDLSSEKHLVSGVLVYDCRLKLWMLCFSSSFHVTQEGLWLWTPAVTSAVWMEYRSRCPRRSHRVGEIIHIFVFTACNLNPTTQALVYCHLLVSDKIAAKKFTDPDRHIVLLKHNFTRCFWSAYILFSFPKWWMLPLSMHSRAFETVPVVPNHDAVPLNVITAGMFLCFWSNFSRFLLPLSHPVWKYVMKLNNLNDVLTVFGIGAAFSVLSYAWSFCVCLCFSCECCPCVCVCLWVLKKAGRQVVGLWLA